MKPRLLAAILSIGFMAGHGAALTLDELAGDPQLWPTEVTAVGSVRGTILQDGKPGGMVLVGNGRKLTVLGIARAGLTGKMGAITVLVPADKTTLWSEVARLHPERAGEVPVVIAPPAAPVVEAPVKPAAPVAKAPAGPSVMQRRLAGHLVRLDGTGLKAVDVAALKDVKFYGLYYSASWCGPCRQFTPQFTRIYREMKQRYPEFEVVFVSADRSAGAMADYMRDDRMPWLALTYDEAQRDNELRRYGGPGIPCLVLVDAQGRVLSDSFEGDNYLGPGKVLQDAHRLLAEAH